MALDKCERDLVEYLRAERVAAWRPVYTSPGDVKMLDWLESIDAEEVPAHLFLVSMALDDYRRERDAVP